METKVDISVIIPLYNSEKYIVDTIHSVIFQEPHNLTYEIIIVDDKSSDNSKELVKKLNHNKVRLIELKKNSGTANARNVGSRLAKGDWIQFLDSDDTICNDLYQKFETSMKSGFNCYLFSMKHEYKDHLLSQKLLIIPDKRAFGNFGSICNKLMKKELCVDFKVNYTFEDSIFIIDVFIQKELFLGHINDAYYKYNRKNLDSKTTMFNDKEYYKMFEYIYHQIDKCDDLTKMFILETFVSTLFKKEIHLLMKTKIVFKTLFKLYRYLPRVIFNQNRHFIKNTIFESTPKSIS